MRSIFFVSVLVFLVSCSGSVNTGSVANLDGYSTDVISGTNITRATKKNAGGQITEEGFISGGKRNGVWLTYYDGEHKGKIKTVASYSDGILSGPYLELSNRGQIEKEVTYANNQYNGRFAVYKFGRVQQNSHYKNNKLDGTYSEYTNNGKIQKEINYKDGKQHGIMRYYNEAGQVTVQYEYKNGEKIGGGMIDLKGPEETEESEETEDK